MSDSNYNNLTSNSGLSRYDELISNSGAKHDLIERINIATGGSFGYNDWNGGSGFYDY